MRQFWEHPLILYTVKSREKKDATLKIGSYAFAIIKAFEVNNNGKIIVVIILHLK